MFATLYAPAELYPLPRRDPWVGVTMSAATFQTDDFYTYGTVPSAPEPPCLCMYHHGETATVECVFSTEQTVANRAILVGAR